ncbi:sensor histidine kinase [Spongisporangium articulatum]|uniref:histidine kinase n=1 Tax=Spongisporangium articulatum TaxID=3362603 RepID=A0ABW8AI75_9ACTN
MRVLAAVLAVSGLGMVGVGVSTVLLQQRFLDERVDASLRTEVSEFQEIALNGTDPTTGQRFSTVEQLLEVALRKQAADRDETFLTLLDGRPYRVNGGERFVALETESALVATLAALPPNARTTLREADTRAGRVRYAAVQVTMPGQDTVGTYVIAHSLARADAEVSATAQRFTVVASISLLVIGVVGWLVAGRLLRPLTSLRRTAARISHTDLSQRIAVTGADDVSELTRTVNGMLDRLEHAFTAQQEFLDDAGHELRTPVTIVRGHLELLDPADPTEVAETRALVLDELDRIDRLVGDLIVLAKARRPDFLRLAPVALGPLTDDVRDKAVALAPDRRWSVDARADVELTADAQRLTQALLQLAHNAVKHTAAGQTIALGSAVTGEPGARIARLWVRDTGAGVAPEDRERIFERFGRAASGRRVEGSGLGLAIVTAIAAAHDGRVELTDTDGGGATFALVLPVEMPLEEEQ